MPDSLIGFGSNQGDSPAIYHQVIDLLDRLPGISVVQSSALIETEPVGGPVGQRVYSNGAIRIETSLSSDELHARLVRTENDLGRERISRWGARRVDLDLLLFGAEQKSTERLTIPHPRMSFRRFVLEPGATVAADMVHQACQMSIGQLLDHLDSTPRKILIVGDSSETRRLVDSFSETFPDWQFSFDVGDRAKLILDIGASPTADESDRHSPRLKGPRLRLRNGDTKAYEVELEAAIEAMKPLSR